jgi:hypothetical protein
MEIIGFIVAVITFPVSIVALLIDWIFHTGFWTAWWIVLIVSAIASTTRNGEEE